MPTGVPTAAVSEAGDVPNEDLIRAEAVSVWAPGRRVGDPLPGRGLQQLTQHDSHLRPYRHFGHNAWWISAALITGASLYCYGVASFGA